MWIYNFKAVKFCFNNSRTVLVNHQIFKSQSLLCHIGFKFLSDIKYPCVFFLHSAKNQFIKHFIETGRNNHSETRIPKLIFKPVTEKGKEISHTLLLESLQSCRSVQEQVELFHSVVKLPDDDIDVRHSICRDLEKALQPYFLSRVSVCLVGSSATGLGFKGCDVDLSLQFVVPNANEEKLLSGMENEQNKVAVNKVYAAKNQLLTVRKILQDLRFEEPLTVIPGRCPILNFSHHGLPCDLSINNRLALHGTNLMLLCGRLDKRVTPLLQIITYWAKHCKIVGGPGKFKTYAIFLLVVYFLQTRSPEVLPSVKTMFHKTEFLENLDNWSYDVTKYLSHFEVSPNCQSIEELLGEFFAFYGNFDFSHIICPINSSSVERKVFSTQIDCDNSFVLNTICIQDPLNLAWNVTTGVSWKHCKGFSKAIIVTWEKFQDTGCWNPESPKWGISALIDHHYNPDNLVNVREFTIDLPFTPLAADHVRFVLSHCLDFECYPLHLRNLGDLPQRMRAVVESQLLKVEGNSCVRHVFGTKDTWLGRNTYSSEVDSVDGERRVSEKLKLQRENSEKDALYFLCESYHSKVGAKECLRVKFKLLDGDRFIPKLVIFLKDYIPKVLEKLK